MVGAELPVLNKTADQDQHCNYKFVSLNQKPKFGWIVPISLSRSDAHSFFDLRFSL